MDRILEESFEGWYLRHAKGILRDIGLVRVAMSAGSPVALIMLKMIEPDAGYIYYIAVEKAHRNLGIAKLLVNDALSYFKEKGAKEVYASVETDNEPSEALFAAVGFTRTSFGEVSRRHGGFRAVNMYRMMVVVPGEVLLRKEV